MPQEVSQQARMANHLGFINEKTIQLFKLYLLPPQFINDFRKIGNMPVHDDRHDVQYIVR